jgi:hypothetical protein
MIAVLAAALLIQPFYGFRNDPVTMIFTPGFATSTRRLEA